MVHVRTLEAGRSGIDLMPREQIELIHGVASIPTGMKKVVGHGMQLIDSVKVDNR